MREVQAYVIEALGVELGKEVLVPIIEKLLEEENASADDQEGGGGGTLTEGGLLCHSPDNEPPTSEPADRQRQAISDAEWRRDGEQRRAARDERERAAHAERQRQQPPEMLIDFESLRKLERKAESMGYSAAAYWDERVEDAKEICPEWLAELREEFDGETRLTAEDSAFGSEAPSLRNYRNPDHTQCVLAGARGCVCMPDVMHAFAPCFGELV